MSTGSGIHAGHRQRMKERFLAGGLDGFSDHEVFELILFYAIPRRDLNELSHRLVERFGSFRAVFEADFDELCSVDGIGENAATLIKLMADSFRRYALDDDQPYLYDNIQKVGNYAVNLYVGVSVEKLYAMLFDNKMMLLDTVMLAEGSVNSVRVSMRTIVEKAIKKNASSIILIHNHPNGTTIPSDEDKRFSTYLKDLLSDFDITLIDHIIVSRQFFKSVFSGEDGENRLASSNPFSYGEKLLTTKIRVTEPETAADISYKAKDEQ